MLYYFKQCSLNRELYNLYFNFIIILNCSGLQEEMELKPKQVCLFAWTDPTKTRKLAWSYSQSFGEHDLLKVNLRKGEVNAEPH